MAHYHPGPDPDVIGSVGALVYFFDGDRLWIRHADWDLRKSNRLRKRTRPSRVTRP